MHFKCTFIKIIRRVDRLYLNTGILDSFIYPDVKHMFLFRSRREAELGELQRCLEEETRRHEAQLSELRIKHTAAIDSLQEQLDNAKRVRLSIYVKCNMFTSYFYTGKSSLYL